MADHSSISSSEENAAPPGHTVPTPRVKGGRADSDGDSFRAGFPWAFCLALVIIAGFELFLHRTHWPKKVPWDFGIDEYRAVAAEINRHGSAEIAVLGSSRAREGLELPILSKLLRTATHEKIHVASYAVAGGRTYDCEAITRRLLRSNPSPRMIIIGTGERDFGSDPGQFDQAPQFWNFDDWKREYQRRGEVVLNDLPTVIRSKIGQWYWTLGYRDALRLQIRNWVTHQKDEPTQLVGESTVWHRTNTERTLATKPVPLADVKSYAVKQTRKPYPNPQLRQSLVNIATLCQAAHVKLVIFQVPIYPLLQHNLSPPAYHSFLTTVRKIAAEHGATFIPATELDVKLSNNDFRDGSAHLDMSGATKVTRALAERYVVPIFTDRPIPTTKPKKKPATLPRAEKAEPN